MSTLQRQGSIPTSNLMSEYGSDRQIPQGSMLDVEREEALRQQWREVTDRLLDWWKDPTQLEDEGAVAPSQLLIERAIRFAHRMREKKWSPPERVVPTDDGGVCFERWADDSTEVLEFMADGKSEFRGFIRGRLETRQPGPVGSEEVDAAPQ